jgi:hypothetical protein
MNQTLKKPSAACPDIGVWRAWLDREDDAARLDEHLAECPGCRRVVALLREDADHVRDAFALLSPGQTDLPSTADVAVARERLEWQRRRTTPVLIPVRSQEPKPMFLTRISTPWRIAASGLAAAVALTILVSVTPEGRALASGFLAQFRSEQVTAIEVSPQSQTEIMRTLNALGNLGTVNMPGGQNGRPEAAVRAASQQAKTVTLAEASTAIGFKLETPDPALLPPGVDKTPRVQVMPSSQIRFTFDKAKASAYLKSTGHEVTVPDKFDGATLVVSIPSAALLQYGGGAGSSNADGNTTGNGNNTGSNAREALIIGQAGELVIDVEGKVGLDEMRDFLLSLPGLPQPVVNQLRQIKSWNQTLPIPVPVDQINWKSTDFNGHQGLLLNDNSGVGSAAIWYENHHMYGVAGSLRADKLKAIAESLAVR